MINGVMTTRGRTTIPKGMRDRLKLKSGDKLHFTSEKGILIIDVEARRIARSRSSQRKKVRK